jgi:hypothetical protein
LNRQDAKIAKNPIIRAIEPSAREFDLHVLQKLLRGEFLGVLAVQSPLSRKNWQLLWGWGANIDSATSPPNNVRR